MTSTPSTPTTPGPRRGLAGVGSLALLMIVPLGCGDDPVGGSAASESDGSAATEDTIGATETGDTDFGDADSDDTDDPGADDLPPGPWDHGEPIPPGEPEDPGDAVPGDPEAGYYALLHAGYVTCGIPWSIWPLAKPFLGDFTRGEPLPGRSGKNAEVPYNWTVHTPASGVEIVSLNCLECHAGKFNGELILGLGVADMDFTSVPMGSLVESLPLFPWPGGALAELTKFVERYQAVGPYIRMFTVGTNPADMLAVRLAAHRDVDTLEWSQEPRVDLPELMAPVDTPPWWRAHKKHGLFYNGMSRGDHRGTMMFASSLCTDNIAEATAIAGDFADIDAYIKSLRPPTYPFAIDGELVARGEAVFRDACAGCHGTYARGDGDASGDTSGDTYPNLIFPVEVIGTDPVVALAADAVAYMVDWFNQSFYGGYTTLLPADPFYGYVAPPLDGIWATAPFLHNGSVPTLELVLDSGARPTSWRRVDFDSRNFDENAVGWPFETLPYGQDTAPPDERRLVYDTTKPGHSAAGHTFGDHLTADDRRALLEYLKTL